MEMPLFHTAMNQVMMVSDNAMGIVSRHSAWLVVLTDSGLETLT